MTYSFQVRLSSGEIYTLAAMLGFSSVIGIEENTLRSWSHDIKRHVRSAIEKLERKKLIECEMQGELKVLPELRSMFSCLCDAQKVLLISGNQNPGRRSTVMVLKGKSGVITVCNLDADTYRLKLYSSYDISDTIKSFLEGLTAFVMKERLLPEDAEWIKEKVLSFQIDEAKQRLLSCVSSANAVNELLPVISGKAHTLEIRELHKKDGYYENIHHTVLAAIEDHAMMVRADEYGMLHFDAVDPNSFLSDFESVCSNFAKEN